MGILAGIARAIADSNVAIEDVTQRIMQDLFVLMMMTDFSESNCTFEEFQTRMQQIGDDLKVKIYVQHAAVFKFQHRL